MKTELLTIPEFCNEARIGRTFAYRLLSENKIKACKLGKKTLIPRAEMHRWIDSLPSYSSENAEA